MLEEILDSRESSRRTLPAVYSRPLAPSPLLIEVCWAIPPSVRSLEQGALHPRDGERMGAEAAVMCSHPALL